MTIVRRLPAAFFCILCLAIPASAAPPPYEVTFGKVRQFLSAVGFEGAIRSVAPIPAEPSDGWLVKFELLDGDGRVCGGGNVFAMGSYAQALWIHGDYSNEERRERSAGHGESELTGEERARWQAALARSAKTWEKAVSDLCGIQAYGGTSDFDGSSFAWRIRYLRLGGPQSAIDWLYVDPFSLRPFRVECRRGLWELPPQER